jgi:hypothetical protein
VAPGGAFGVRASPARPQARPELAPTHTPLRPVTTTGHFITGLGRFVTFVKPPAMLRRLAPRSLRRPRAPEPQPYIATADNPVLDQEKEEKMKIKVQRIVIALAACALLNVFALAGVKSKSVTFHRDVQVGGKLIKKGTYKVNFNEETKELSVISGKEVIARSTAQLEDSDSASKYVSVYTSLKDTDGNHVLMSINMGGKYAVISDQYTAQAKRASDAQ